jgi:hypothetical protein
MGDLPLVVARLLDRQLADRQHPATASSVGVNGR